MGSLSAHRPHPLIFSAALYPRYENRAWGLTAGLVGQRACDRRIGPSSWQSHGRGCGGKPFAITSLWVLVRSRSGPGREAMEGDGTTVGTT